MKEALLSILQSHPWADKLHWYDTIDSTNSQAKVMALKGAPHGTVLIADRQTGGRGRMGRSFCSPGGAGIYMSVILRPECRATEIMHLTCAVAVAMCDAVERSCGLRPGVKWINDLLIGDKKLGGILTELSLLPGTDWVSYAVVGIGINCHQEPEDFPEEIRNIAISLKTASGMCVPRQILAAEMVKSICHMDSILLADKDGILEQYRKDCVTLGQDIYLVKGEEKTPCRGLTIDSEGALIVEFSDGSTQAVNSGEVSVRPQ